MNLRTAVRMTKSCSLNYSLIQKWKGFLNWKLYRMYDFKRNTNCYASKEVLSHLNEVHIYGGTSRVRLVETDSIAKWMWYDSKVISGSFNNCSQLTNVKGITLLLYMCKWKGNLGDRNEGVMWKIKREDEKDAVKVHE